MILPYPFLESYTMFFIYSFVGWIVEVVYYGVTEGKFINRGFLAGPLCPVYGLGFYAAVWLFKPFVGNFFVIFFGMAAAATLVELIAGIILYHTFHMRWWDYSDYKLNFRGYICLRFFIYWGIACSLGIYVLHPAVLWLVDQIPYVAKIVVLSLFTLLMVIDIITTIGTIIGFRKKLAAFARVTSGVKVVSDKIGEQIYGSVDTIITVSEPTKKHYDEYRKLILENRKAERELAATHRAEERAFAEQFTDAEMESFRLARKAAANTRDTFINSFKYSEQRVLAIVSTVGDLPSSALTRLKKLVRYKEHGIYASEEPDIAELEAELLSAAEADADGIPGELE
jgi:uncharacterized membrane protein